MACETQNSPWNALEHVLGVAGDAVRPACNSESSTWNALEHVLGVAGQLPDRPRNFLEHVLDVAGASSFAWDSLEHVLDVAALGKSHGFREGPSSELF